MTAACEHVAACGDSRPAALALPIGSCSVRSCHYCRCGQASFHQAARPYLRGSSRSGAIAHTRRSLARHTMRSSGWMVVDNEPTYRATSYALASCFHRGGARLYSRAVRETYSLLQRLTSAHRDSALDLHGVPTVAVLHQTASCDALGISPGRIAQPRSRPLPHQSEVVRRGVRRSIHQGISSDYLTSFGTA